MTSPMIPLVALVGPTAVGKTALALALADHLRDHIALEVVSADSRQVYRLMDVATAKPSAMERSRLPHHLIDMIWPDEGFTLAQYQQAAQDTIAAVWARGRLPLLVGGTGLYVRAVLDGLTIPEVAPNPAVRAELEDLLAREGLSALHARLARLDPSTAARIDARNPRRLIRALEVYIVTGRPFSEQQGKRPTPYRPLLFGLDMERGALYARADTRIAGMLAAGLVGETEALVARGYSWDLPSMSSLGYREVGAYLRGELSLDAALERFRLATHKYIRRQLTWFRSNPQMTWLDAALPIPTLATSLSERVRAQLAEEPRA